MLGRVVIAAPVWAPTLALLFPFSAPAQCPDYRQRVALQANVPIAGELHEIARIGNRLFIGATGEPGFSGGMHIVNVANPAAPFLVGTLAVPAQMPHPVSALAVSGSLVVTAGVGSRSFVTIIETAGGLPQILSTTLLSGSGQIGGLALEGTLLLVADGLNGLYILDITDPVNPAILANYAVAAWEVTGCAMSGSLAYLTGDGPDLTYSSVRVLDISTPTAPVLIGAIAGDERWAPALSGTDLFTAAGDSRGEVVRYDVSNPGSPVEMESHETGTMTRLRVVGDRLYATGKASSFDYGYGQICVFDLGDFAAGPIGFLRPHGGWDVLVEAPDVYVGTDRGGLDVVQIFSEESVIPDRSIYDEDAYGHYPITVEELVTVGSLGVQLELAYVFGGPSSYLAHTFDLTDPRQPTGADTAYSPTGTLKRLDATDDLAVVTSDRGLETLDLSPLAFAGWAPVTSAEDVSLDGDYAYVSRSAGGIDIVDVTVPAAPSVVANVATAGSNPEIVAENGYLYVTDSVDGLRIYDLANPANPVPVATAVLPEAMDGLTLADGKAYLKNGASGSFYVVDVSSPASPVVEGFATLLPGRPRLVSAAGHTGVYALFDSGASRRGFQVIDVQDPSQPLVLEDVYFPFAYEWVLTAQAIALVEDEVFCASGGWAYHYPLACPGTAVGAVPPLPMATAGIQGFPNPFLSATRIRFDIPRAGPATLSVHDARGRLVREISTGLRSAGRHTASWDGRDATGRPVASGVYFLRLETGGRVQVGRTTLLR